MERHTTMLAARDWSDAVQALPELDRVADVRDQFKVVHYPEGGAVPDDSLYLVLDGQVSLRLRGEEVGKARREDFFFEENLVINEIATNVDAYALPGTRLLKLHHTDWSAFPADSRDVISNMLFGDLVNVHMHDFQQPINCCNVTAAAFSLTALGYPTNVDDIFRDCNLPTAYVVNTGLTLGEMYDVACAYVHQRGLKDEIEVQCHYLDEELVSEQSLLDAICESDAEGGVNDILVANFGVGLAHGIDNNDGGHFALIAKCNPRTGIVHMVDVHPEKYGKLWVTNVRRLYLAMTARDGSSFRSRGLLRFSVGEATASILDALPHDISQVDMTDHLHISRGNIASHFNRSTTNLNSLSTLAMALRLQGYSDASVDEMIAAANIPHSQALSYVPTIEMLAQTVQRYLSHTGTTGISCLNLNYEDDAEAGESRLDFFRRQLQEVSQDSHAQLLFNVDINKVAGCVAVELPSHVHSETALLKEFWCVALDYDAETDAVTITDSSSATSQVWKAPVEKLFAGLESHTNPEMLCLTRSAGLMRGDIEDIVSANRLVLFYADDDPWSHMLESVMGNIGATDLYTVNLSNMGDRELRWRQQLIAHSGKDDVPYLYFDGECLGEVEFIMQMVQAGSFQEMLQGAGLNVLMKTETPSLDNNIFGYPKGGLTEKPDARKNILVACCGSSAADKIPELVERLVAEGHDVKLVPSKPAEHFFKDFGMDRILKTLKPSDIYRDDDEWNFRYTDFGMPVRACHLALCDWADCVVVAPVTCNTMGKIANGVADSLLTSVFVAWQYQRKPVVFCPACNTHMWNNLTTQNNVAQLKRLGVHFEGPRSGMLSNGTIGTGMMATVDEICGTVLDALDDLENQEARVMKWGAQAAAADDHREWARIFRTIDEDVVGINVCSDSTGDTLLHYAAGGEGKMMESGIERGVPDIEAAQDLIRRGIDVNMKNDYDFTPLHVAIMNDSATMVSLLLDAGADAAECVAFARSRDTDAEVLSLLDKWAIDNNVEVTADEKPTLVNEESILYFTYGSLKRGFPNWTEHSDVLSDFVGTAVTRQAMPLIVPHEPNCENPSCPWLHRMPTLVDMRGRGKQVKGEVFRVPVSGLAQLDVLEGYKGPGNPDNVYERKQISVRMAGEVVKVTTYVIADAQSALAMWQNGEADAVGEYTEEMAAATPKPGYDPDA